MKEAKHDSVGALEKVRTITIESIIVEAGFDRASIIKLDIEGAEHKLFLDAEWLSSTDVLIAELHDRIVPGCTSAFEVATIGRENFSVGGEKFVSIRKTTTH